MCGSGSGSGSGSRASRNLALVLLLRVRYDDADQLQDRQEQTNPPGAIWGYEERQMGRGKTEEMVRRLPRPVCGLLRSIEAAYMTQVKTMQGSRSMT